MLAFLDLIFSPIGKVLCVLGIILSIRGCRAHDTCGYVWADRTGGVTHLRAVSLESGAGGICFSYQHWAGDFGGAQSHGIWRFGEVPTYPWPRTDGLGMATGRTMGVQFTNLSRKGYGRVEQSRSVTVPTLLLVAIAWLVGWGDTAVPAGWVWARTRWFDQPRRAEHRSGRRPLRPNLRARWVAGMAAVLLSPWLAIGAKNALVAWGWLPAWLGWAAVAVLGLPMTSAAFEIWNFLLQSGWVRAVDQNVDRAWQSPSLRWMAECIETAMAFLDQHRVAELYATPATDDDSASFRPRVDALRDLARRVRQEVPNDIGQHGSEAAISAMAGALARWVTQPRLGTLIADRIYWYTARPGWGTFALVVLAVILS